MKRCFLWITIFVCLCSSNTLGGWKKQHSGTLAWLRSIYFFNQQTGFVVGSNGTILKTSDGGAIWTKLDSPTRDNLRDVIFFDADSGWILAERNQFTLKKNEARSYLWRTADGGATWKVVNFPPNSSNPTLVRFVTDARRQQLWVSGALGALYALSTNGKTWQKQTSPTDYLLLGGCFSSEKQGWLVSADGSLFSTPDGGASWRHVSGLTAHKSRLNAVFFSSPRVGWVVGASGKIYATTNGAEWREQQSNVVADLFDAQFIDDKEGWTAGDNGALLHTTDAGRTWTIENVNGFTGRLERLFFVKHNNQNARGWAVGFGGTILTYQK